MDVAGRFAKNLIRCRKRAGISQEELGARAAVHRTDIGKFEGGKRLPRIDTLVKLAGALATSPNDLLDGIEWKPSGDTPTPGGFSISDGDRSN